MADTTHLVIGDNGPPLCGFTRKPHKDWPHGHGAINVANNAHRRHEATCFECKKIAADYLASTGHG